MTTFLPICILWITTCVGLLSAKHVFGKESSTVVLPCTLRVVGGTPYIRWSTDKGDVFERKGKESFQGDGYGGRVTVPETQLLKGDCSLELKNLTLADKGVYQSYQAVRRTKRSTRVDDKWDLISSVTVDVTPVPSKETNQKSVPTGDARTNWPHPQVMVLSLFSCFVFQLFYEEM
ncbi:uncharacterized protein LOC128618088 [Ictalurus furcatus]|uniref:uncharacterized protein LOC128618088 n=1 Tax=Ictalurus furcatus TaxID=66913 RepID=UPI00234FD5A9|nr:uncharacterized protein LOC128618088 [Ictalurus furcatus]